MKMMDMVDNKNKMMLDMILMWFMVIKDLVEEDSGGL